MADTWLKNWQKFDPVFKGMTLTQARASLRGMGYNVDTSGPMTSRLESAMRWATKYHTVQPNPQAGNGSHAWNAYDANQRIRTQRQASGRGPILPGENPANPPVRGGRTGSPADKGKKFVPGKNGQEVDPQGGGPTASPTGYVGSGMPGYDLGSLPNPNVFQPVSVKNAKMGAQLFDPHSADSLAGIQFDPQINQTRANIANIAPDLAQHMQDIASWYGQVNDQLGKSRTGIQNTAAALTAASGKSTQGILNSLGGSAFGGAAAIGAQGAQNAGEIAATGNADVGMMDQLAPLLAASHAAAGQKETTRMNNMQNDYQQQLTSLLGQRGQEKENQLFNIRGQNNSILDNRANKRLSILQYNRQGKQQNFSNAVSAQSAAIAAAMNNQQLKILGQQADAATPGRKLWDNIDPTTQTNAMEALGAQYLDANRVPTVDNKTLFKAMFTAALSHYKVPTPAAKRSLGQAIRAWIIGAEGRRSAAKKTKTG